MGYAHRPIFGVPKDLAMYRQLYTAMAQTTANSLNIIGSTLIADAATWCVKERCGQDLLIVVARATAFPTKLNAFENKVADKENFSFISGVYKNNADNVREIAGLYPAEDYAVFHGTMRGAELCFLQK